MLEEAETKTLLIALQRVPQPVSSELTRLVDWESRSYMARTLIFVTTRNICTEKNKFQDGGSRIHQVDHID